MRCRVRASSKGSPERLPTSNRFAVLASDEDQDFAADSDDELEPQAQHVDTRGDASVAVHLRDTVASEEVNKVVLDISDRCICRVSARA